MRTLFFIFILLLSSITAYAQQRVSGFVKDAKSGELLIGATVLDLESKAGTVTNPSGYFSVYTMTPNRTFRISFMGYESQQITVSGKDTLLQVRLQPSQTILGEAEITATAYRPVFNVAKLSTSEIINIPSITGKPDVLKALQFLPGMRSQGEASSVVLVRGGNPGENLYLLDNTPLIYVHHIGGYMSVFNSDMINDIEVYKGGFPAKYGEKLSSIMNITQKSGDQSAFKGSFSIGVSDVSIALEGPTKLKNSSYILTARKTLTDFLYLGVTALTDMGAMLMYGFHDINGKFTWSPDARNTFAVNFYQGDDYFQVFSKKMMPDDARFRKGNTWGNWLGSVNWNHLLPSNVMLNNTLSFTHYRLKDVMTLKPSDTDIEAGMQDIRRKTRSALQDVSLRSDATYAFRKNWDLDFGMKLTYLHFRPMKFTNNIPGMGNHDEYANAFEPAVYVSNKIKPLKWLDAEVGLRGVGYFNGSMTNFSVEPRLNVNLFLHENHIFNLSAMRVSQNAQMIQNVGSLTANEIYVPSGKDIPVSYSNQFSVGYQTFFDDKNYQLEIDAYYKTLSHLTTYKDGYGYAMGDIFWREKLETGGTGLAHGLEFLFKKNKGKFTGFLSYTYSKSTRQYAGINRGETYDFEYDSPHDIAVSLGYQLSDKWSFGATWQYQTGLPYTPAIGRHIALDEAGSPYEVLIYGDKNSARMGAYHRLDIAFKKKTYTKKRRREGDMLIKTSNRRAEWTFGIHNVYNRQNPYFYYYAQSQYGEMFLGPDVPLKQYQIAMFPFIPMISFKFWFGDGSKEW